MVGIK